VGSPNDVHIANQITMDRLADITRTKQTKADAMYRMAIVAILDKFGIRANDVPDEPIIRAEFVENHTMWTPDYLTHRTEFLLEFEYVNGDSGAVSLTVEEYEALLKLKAEAYKRIATISTAGTVTVSAQYDNQYYEVFRNFKAQMLDMGRAIDKAGIQINNFKLR